MSLQVKKINFRRIALYCSIGFVFCLLSVVFISLYSYNLIYNESVSQSTAAINGSLKTEQQKMGSITASYGSWNMSYENMVIHPNSEWINTNIIGDLKSNFQIPYVAIFNDDKSFSTLYSNKEIFGIKDKSAPPALVNILLSYKNYIGNEKFITGYIKDNNQIYLVAVSKIQGTSIKTNDKISYLMTIKPITEAFLTDLSNNYNLSNLTLINQLDSFDTTKHPYISIKDRDKTISYLTWTPLDSASGVLKTLILAGLLVILLLCGISFMISRKIYQAAHGYRHMLNDLSTTSQNLNMAQKSVSTLKQAKTKFLSMMSHEIKTPMNGLVGMINLLRDTELTETQTLYVNTMETSADSLIKLVDNILDFSKLESDEVSLVYGEVNIRQVISEIHGLLFPVSLQKKLKFELSFSDDVPLTVSTDGVRLRQIMLHLITNALKFTKVGTVRVNVTAENLPGNRVELGIQVVDTGIGIAEGIKETLFNDFVHVGQTPPQAQAGAGLGLSIVKNLVSLLQGKVGIESNLGQGSVFWIKLEVDVIKKFKKKEGGIALKSSGKGKPSSKSILIIDEEKGGLIHELLEKNGDKIAKATGITEAVPLMSQHQFDAVVINILDTQTKTTENPAASLRSAMVTPAGEKNTIPIFVIINEDQQHHDLKQYDGVIHPPLTSTKLKNLLKGINPID